MKVSDKALVIFALILISFLAALISYKGFGESDNKEHLPMLYRMIDSSYLKNDWFVNENSSIFNVRIYFHYLMFGLHFLISNIAILYFIIFFIAYLGTAHASFLISKHLNGNDGSALLVTSLILIGGSFTLGGNFIIHDVTTPHLLAFTLSLYGIYFILKERYVWFSVFLGLATMIHFLLGGLIFGVVLLSDIIRRKKKAKILLPILVFLPFALFLIPMFLAQVSSGAHLSGQQFTFIDAYFKHPHHQVPFSWSPLLYIEFVLFLGLFIYSYINLRKISKDMIIIPYSIIIIAALCFIGAVTVEFYPIKFITQLQFFRLTTLVSFFEYQIIGLLIYFALSKKSHFSEKVPYLMLALSLMHQHLALIGIPLFFALLLLNKKSHKFRSLFYLIVLIFFLLIISIAIFRYPALLLKSELYTSQIMIVIFKLGLIIPFLALAVNNNKKIKYLAIFSIMITISLYIAINPGFINNHYEPSVVDIQKFIQNNTPVDTILLVPPYIDSFRTGANRAIVVDFNFPFSEKMMLEWYNRTLDVSNNIQFNLNNDRYAELKRGYSSLNYSDVIRLKEKYNFTYFVSEKPSDYDFKVVYENEDFVLYKVQ